MSDDVIVVGFIPYDSDPVLVSIPRVDHLSALQALVGGSIEGIYPNEAVTLFGWDEARIFGTPTNFRATALCARTYGYPIVGDVVACCSDGEGETTSLHPYLIPEIDESVVLDWYEALFKTKERRNEWLTSSTPPTG